MVLAWTKVLALGDDGRVGWRPRFNHNHLLFRPLGVFRPLFAHKSSPPFEPDFGFLSAALRNGVPAVFLDQRPKVSVPRLHVFGFPGLFPFAHCLFLLSFDSMRYFTRIILAEQEPSLLI